MSGDEHNDRQFLCFRFPVGDARKHSTEHADHDSNQHFTMSHQRHTTHVLAMGGVSDHVTLIGYARAGMEYRNEFQTENDGQKGLHVYCTCSCAVNSLHIYSYSTRLLIMISFLKGVIFLTWNT